MKKGDLMKEIEKLDNMGIPRSSYVVIYGGAMVFHGIKEDTHDLDLWSIDSETFCKIADMGFETDRLTDGAGNHQTVIHISEHTDIYNGQLWSPIKFSDDVYGINVQTPESICLEKMARGREKDKKDVELIEKWGLTYEDVIAKIAAWDMRDSIIPVTLDYVSSKLINTKDIDISACIEKLKLLAASHPESDVMISDTRKSYDKHVPLKEGYDVSKDNGGGSYLYLD